MSEAKSGGGGESRNIVPGYRFAHPGYRCAASDLDISGAFHGRIYLTKVGVAAGFLAFVPQYSGRNKKAQRGND